ncbi:MAG: manganese efflux pump [Clostridia bacterium]|nr:manganese efflux pump [Clostridia bacterium]
MSIIELFLIGVSLSMDAFAVSICKGLSVGRIKPKHMISAGIWFGGFQALMPAIGYFLGSRFAAYIEAYDHWIAFGLLLIIGANMIKESFEKDEGCCCDGKAASVSPKAMLMPAIATSIDALAVGVAFAMVSRDGLGIGVAAAIIGVITFAVSMAGVKIGGIFGSHFKHYAERTGGVILIIIGIKIVLEHLGILAF